MNISKDLEKIGIIPLDKVKIEEKNYIAKSIADKLATNIKELSDCYNELYMRMFNCDMYYANVAEMVSYELINADEMITVCGLDYYQDQENKVLRRISTMA